MAPQYHFAAESLAKLSNTELSACIGAVLTSELECPWASTTISACNADIGSSALSWVFRNFFPEQSVYQKDIQLVYFGSQLSPTLSIKSNWALKIGESMKERMFLNYAFYSCGQWQVLFHSFKHLASNYNSELSQLPFLKGYINQAILPT